MPADCADRAAGRPDDQAEHVLEGGNVAQRVVRLGQTVRKPAGPHTPAVEAFLAHLQAAGFTGAPHSLGRDEQGRHVLEYVPGQLAMDAPPMDLAGLSRVGRLLRDLHDKSQDFEPPPDAHWLTAIPPDRRDLICHHDLAPWNLVIDADRWVFIDWDGAGPGSRLWDLAYAVQGFAFNGDRDPAAHAVRLSAIADGYGLDGRQRADLPPLIGARTRAMFDLLRNSARTGQQPWARLHADGHGDYWGPAAEYAEANTGRWARALIPGIY
jgi:Ser/Thr protein kinase RdoA (MazF antagonist)